MANHDEGYDSRLAKLLMFSGSRIGIYCCTVGVMHLSQEMTELAGKRADLAYMLGRSGDLFDSRPSNIRQKDEPEGARGTRVQRRQLEHEAQAFIAAAREIFSNLQLNLDELIDPALAKAIEEIPEVPVNDRLCEAFKDELQHVFAE